MTTIGVTHDQERIAVHPIRSGIMLRRVLLGCGILSSLLYVAIDLVGGLRYEGYRFTSQAISELAAIGAPSKSFVDPLFLLYQVLVLAFGAGVVWAAAGRNRGLRITGAALMAYGAIGAAAGVVGPAFSMHQRGMDSLASDAPHIILTGVLVLLLLIAIGFGAFALGTRFRTYSLATLLTVIMLGMLAAPYATRLATGQPTPGLGIIERIDVYSAMLWVAVLSLALLRRPDSVAEEPLP